MTTSCTRTLGPWPECPCGEGKIVLSETAEKLTFRCAKCALVFSVSRDLLASIPNWDNAKRRSFLESKALQEFPPARMARRLMDEDSPNFGIPYGGGSERK